MDNLLRQLRHSMTELSIQGEDFARQMWRMYSIFEEFLETHIGWNHSINANEELSQSEMLFSSNQQLLLPSPNANSGLQTSFQPQDLSLEHSDVNSSPTNDGSSGKALSSPRVCNPLLETIRIIQSLDQAEDYANLQECCGRTKVKMPPTSEKSSQGGDGDKDSIGYAGSNSIDSGYKSSCPTPDLSDGSCYGGDGGKGSSCSSLNRSHEGKPRIAMGTRVMHRQHQHLYGGTGRSTQGSPCDVNLDHLMYLRQTLFSAMQQCESGTAGSQDPSSPPKFPKQKEDSFGQGSPRLSSYQRSPDHNHFLQCAALEAQSRRMPSPTLGSRQLRTPSPRSNQRLRRVSSPSLATWQRPPSPVHSDVGDFYSNHGFRPYKNARSEPSVSSDHDECYAQNFRQFSSSMYSSRSARSVNPRLLDLNSYDISDVSNTLPSSLTHKTIRFNMDGDGRNSQMGGNVPGKNHGRDSESNSPGKGKGKPILKDPICANLRAQLELNPNDPSIPMLEEEIDTLLYGKTANRSVNQFNDLPCSYVTMIEDKYRRSSLARVKKLRDKVSDANPYPSEATNGSLHVDNGLLLDEPLQLSPNTPNGDPNHKSSSEQTPDMKSRFSEVARCMLEIIEDLQRQKLLANPSVEETVQCPPDANRKDPPINSSEPQKTSDSTNDTTVAGASFNYDIGRLRGADYHVYEEIVYDLGIDHQRHSPHHSPSPRQSPRKIGKSNSPLPQPPPPPLPRRPDTTKFRGSPVSPPKVSVASSSSSQPKQRLNLYSIFQEQSDRRSIALSLEQEWRLGQEASSPDDEYGFKMAASIGPNSTNGKFL